MIKDISNLRDLIKRCINNDIQKVEIKENNKVFTMTYDELGKTVICLSNKFYESGIRTGDYVILQIDSIKNYVLSVLSIIYIGGVPIILPLCNNIEQYRRFLKIKKENSKAYVLYDKIGKEYMNLYNKKESIKELFFEDSDFVSMNTSINYNINLFEIEKAQDIALIQYSSGTTSDPKGIMTTHDAIINVINSMNKTLKITEEDIFLSWMPLTHASGLIGFLFMPLINNSSFILLETNSFMENPKIWFNELEKTKATISMAPNFAFQYSSNKITNTDNWDLSQVRMIFNAGEPISKMVLKQFKHKMDKFFKKENYIIPAYGLTETTLYNVVNKSYKANEIDEKKLSSGINFQIDSIKNVLKDVVCVGEAIEGTYARIVNDDFEELENYVIGNVQMGGFSICKGYLNRKSEDTFYKGWLNTGDIGFMIDNNLYVVGRKKDIVFSNGKNIYLTDIEQIIRKHLNGRVAVCGDYLAKESKSNIYVFIELNDMKDLNTNLKEQITHLVLDETGIRITDIIVMRHLMVTNSGKYNKPALLDYYKNCLIKEQETNRKKDILKKLNSIFESSIDFNTFTVDIMGDSISKFQNIALINKYFNVKLGMLDIVKSETIGDLIDCIIKLEKQELKVNKSYSDLEYANKLTKIQQAYYIGRSQDFHGNQNSTHFYVEFKHNLDINKIENCINKLICRHDALRSSFKNEEQIIYDRIEIQPYRIIKHSISDKEIDQFMERTRLEHQKNIFKLEKWPMFEVIDVDVQDKYHILIIDIDMMIVDGMSLFILLEEFQSLYNDKVLPKLNMTYKDSIYTLNESKDNNNYETDRIFWSKKIKTFPKAPKLPVNKTFSTEGNYFSRMKKKFSKEEWSKLYEFAAKNNVTISVVLCYLFTKTLSKWSENKEFALNITLCNRPKLLLDKNNIVGDFTSSVLFDFISSDYKNDIKTDIINFRDKLYSYFDHNSFEGVEMVRALAKSNIEKESVMPIVFTSMLFDQKETFNLGEIVYNQTQTSQVSLDNQTIKYNEEYYIIWDYLYKIYPEGIIKDMFEYYINLIQAIIKENDISKVELPNLKYVNEYNKTAVNEEIKPLNELIEESFKIYKKNEMINLNKEVFTYGEMEEKSNRIIGYLQSLGIKHGDRITLITSKNIESIAVIISLVRMGVVYIPVADNWPLERIEFIRKDSNSKLTLNTNEIYDSCKNKSINYELLPMCNLDDSVYIIYTSGSSGVPKGVEITNEGVVNTIKYVNKMVNAAYDDKFIALAALNFDLSVYDIFGSIASGGCLVLVNDQRDTEEVRHILQKNNITIWNSVPAVMELFLEGIEDNYINYDLEYVLLSGDWIRVNLPNKIKKHFPKASVISLGGATEASIWSIYYEIEKVDKQWNSIPYGYPLPNQNIYILNENLEQCPFDVPGEIYIGGSGVAKKYVGKNKIINNAFIQHKDYGRIYKTGDYGKLSKEGYIVFLGRRDNQVKINGHRIELNEIEANLKKHPSIKEAVVIVKENKIIAYYTGENVNKQVINKYLQNFLPMYMIPNKLIFMKKLPLNSNGKINRKKLCNYDIKEVDGFDGINKKCEVIKFKGKINSMQNELLKIWKDTLKITNLNINDNFFDLGGDSFTAQKIIRKIEEIYGIKIPFIKMIENGNIQNIESYLKDNLDFIEECSITEEKEDKGILPLYELFKFQDKLYEKTSPNRIEYGDSRYNSFKKEVLSRYKKSSDMVLFNNDNKIPQYMEERRSIREFDVNKKVSFKAFQNILTTFRQKIKNGDIKYLYPSSGGLYAIDIYIYIKKDRVDNIEQGLYLYNPVKNGIVKIDDFKYITSDIHYFNNKEIFKTSAFSVFFVYNAECNMPVYGALGNYNALIDTGIMVSQLSLVGEMKGINSCSIGDMDFNKINEMLKLNNNQMVLHDVEMGIKKENEIIESKEVKEFPLTEVQLAYLNGRNDMYDLGKYNAHYYFELEVDYNGSEIEKAIQGLIKRHCIFRTIFNKKGVQKVLEDVPNYNIEIITAPVSENESNVMIKNIRGELSHKNYDYKKWPLFTFKVLERQHNKNILFISISLLICDGASFQVFVKELRDRLMGNFNEKKLDYTFGEYAAYLNKRKQTSSYNKARKYWMDKTNEFSSYPQLPMIEKISLLKNYSIDRKSIIINSNKWNQIKSIAKKNRISSSALLCSIFAKVLSKWSNQPEILLNLTVFERLPIHEDVDSIIGDFTKLIPLNVSMKNKGIFEIAKKVQTDIFMALENIEYDGTEVIREISKRNSSIGKAIMPVVFTSMLSDDSTNYINDLGDIKYAVSQTPQVFLDCQVMDIEGELYISWDYVKELFDVDVIDIIFKHFSNFINKINEESVSNNDNIKELWESYNETDKDISKYNTLQELFEYQAKKTPTNVAIRFEDRKLTYEEIEQKSNQVARYLCTKGICGSNVRVGVLALRKPETIISIIGILKTGAAYVPIEPTFPKKRKKLIMEDSNCKILLDDSIYKDETLKKYNSSPMGIISQPNSLAYIIYTSGSTGMPKGVMIKNNAVCNTIYSINDKINLNSQDVILGISSICFDLSVYDIFGAFSVGGSLVITKDPRNCENILNDIKIYKITIWNSVPIIMNMLVDYIYRENISLDSHIRTILLSGDWIPLPLPSKINKNFSKASIISLGGATEASIWSIGYEIEKVNEKWTSIPYGYPLANQKIYILDYDLELCPPNVKGDIYIGGKGLASEYNNDEEKTKLAFIDHESLGRLYKTGDVGVFSKNGYVELIGRLDNQVKVRGYRVELKEIEIVLLKNKNIAEAVVTVVTTPNNSKQLVGYVISTNEKIKLDFTEIRKDISKLLPDYMIPSKFIELEQMPTTKNGKVDKKSLPLPRWHEVNMDQHIKPKNKIQEELIEIWQNVLNVKDINIKDNFYSLGGDSIILIELVECINKKLNIKISIEDILKSETIEKLSIICNEKLS